MKKKLNKLLLLQGHCGGFEEAEIYFMHHFTTNIFKEMLM